MARDEWLVSPASRLGGEALVPGDKSVSHRALLVSGMAPGVSRLSNVQQGADCLATLEALRVLGVRVEVDGAGRVVVEGRGPAGFEKPAGTIDCRNSGTTMRLLCGMLAGLPFETSLTGDRSLSARPMRRVIEPLALMGASIRAREGEYPPLVIRGGKLSGIEYRLPVASAQVKSAILLAGIQASGRTVVTGPAPTRDHTERMLGWFGADIEPGADAVSVLGGRQLSARDVEVPGDFSAAAFFLAAAALVPGSEVTIPGVGLNPTRTAFLDVVREMGLEVEICREYECSGEPAGTLRARGGRALKGLSVSGARIANLIDELPLIAVLGAFAEGQTEVSDASELRVKETDRISAIAGEARRIGIAIEEKPDGFIVRGPQSPAGGRAASRGDHRIAMSLAVAGLASREGVAIADPACIAVSFPGFREVLEKLVG